LETQAQYSQEFGTLNQGNQGSSCSAKLDLISDQLAKLSKRTSDDLSSTKILQSNLAAEFKQLQSELSVARLGADIENNHKLTTT